MAEEEIERVNSERVKVLSQLYHNNKEMERIKAESKRIKAESKRIKSLESKEAMKRLNAESKCLKQERDRLKSIYEQLTSIKSSWPSKEINPTYPTISVATWIDMINSEAAFERNMENLKNMATMSSVGTFGAPNSHSINKQLVPSSSNKRLKVSATAKEMHFNKDESAIRKLQVQAQHLIDEGAKVVAAGANPLLIARSVEKQTEALVNEFKAMSKEALVNEFKAMSKEVEDSKLVQRNLMSDCVVVEIKEPEPVAAGNPMDNSGYGYQVKRENPEMRKE